MINPLYDALFSVGVDGAPAIVTEAGALTYADLNGVVARWANAIVSLGVNPGDRVAVQVEKSAANLILYLATVRAGAVYLPLNTAYTHAELAYFLGDAEPALVVCDPSAKVGVAQIAGPARVETLDRDGQGTLASIAGGQPTDFITVPRDATDLAAICYTSGTTGRSKGAMLSHRALVTNAATLVELWRFNSSDVLIHALPIYHVHGLFVATNIALMAGAAMLLQARFDAGSIIEALPRATVLMGVPTFYTRLLAHPGLTREQASGVRLFISGSAPLLPETHRTFEERTGHFILERYGMTETGMNTSNPYDGDRIPGTVGFPLPDVALRIVDPETGAPVGRGEIGGIEVKGPNVCAGYWRNSEKTAEAFREDGYFITGDLGVIDDRGYVSIVGRGKDLVISGGLNVYPKEVEAELDEIAGVVESAVIGLPHADLGEAVTAIVATGGASTLTEAGILATLGDRLAAFKRPKRVLFTDDLPRNAMGKVQKALLREQHAHLYD